MELFRGGYILYQVTKPHNNIITISAQKMTYLICANHIAGVWWDIQKIIYLLIMRYIRDNIPDRWRDA